MAIPPEEHRVYVYDKGGRTRIGMITPTSEVRWGRIDRAISAAKVTTLNPDPDCCRMLGQIEPGRHELVIYRGRKRVWEGPLMRPDFTTQGVVIRADDVLRYTSRTILRGGYDDSSTPRTVEGRARQIIENELARHESLTPPINVLPHLRTYVLAQTRQSRTILPYEKYLFDELEDLGSKSGLRFAAVGRSIVLWDRNDNRLGRTDTLTEKDFSVSPVVTPFGMELATFAAATDGEGHYGWVGGPDPYYGLWELLDTVRPEGEAALETPSRASLQEQARINLAGRNPTPTRLRVPAGATLDPRTALTIDQLVPGVRVPVRANLACRTLDEDMVIHEVEVVENSNGETVSVTLEQATDVAADLQTGGDTDG